LWSASEPKGDLDRPVDHALAQHFLAESGLVTLQGWAFQSDPDGSRPMTCHCG